MSRGLSKVIVVGLLIFKDNLVGHWWVAVLGVYSQSPSLSYSGERGSWWTLCHSLSEIKDLSVDILNLLPHGLFTLA